MKIFAHRGFSGSYPENTILAFKKALSLPVDGLELDVHMSKDRQLVVIHDENIKRTFKGKGLVKDYTLSELKSFKCKKFRYRNNELCKIPTLEEIILLTKDKNITLNIEAKTDDIEYDLEEDMLKLLKKYNIEEKVIISSFNHKTLDNFQKLNSKIRYGALYPTKEDLLPDEDIIEHAKKHNIYSIHLNKKLCTEKIIDLAHKNNIKVFVYTIHFRYQLNKLIKINADGIFVNRPDLMYEYLNK